MLRRLNFFLGCAVLCLAVALAGCGDKGKSGEKPGDVSAKSKFKLPDNYSWHYSKAKNISVAYPKNWEPKDNADGVMVFSPLEGEGDKFAENVNVVVGSSGGLSLQSYYDLNMKGLKGTFKDYKEVSTSEIEIDGVKAKRALVSYELEGIKVDASFYVLTKGQKGIAIVATGLFGQLDKYIEDFDNIAKSFKFGK